MKVEGENFIDWNLHDVFVSISVRDNCRFSLLSFSRSFLPLLALFSLNTRNNIYLIDAFL
jgi:hypothetical protein